MKDCTQRTHTQYKYQYLRHDPLYDDSLSFASLTVLLFSSQAKMKYEDKNISFQVLWTIPILITMWPVIIKWHDMSITDFNLCWWEKKSFDIRLWILHNLFRNPFFFFYQSSSSVKILHHLHYVSTSWTIFSTSCFFLKCHLQSIICRLLRMDCWKLSSTQCMTSPVIYLRDHLV